MNLLLMFAFLLGQPTDFDQHLDISPEEYKARRDSLREKLPDHPIVIMGQILRTRSNDTDFAFRQSSDFYYLTGFNEPDAYLVLSKQPFEYEGKSVTELIFVPENKGRAVTYVGRSLGPDGAMNKLGFEMAAVVASGNHWRGNYQNHFETFMKSLVKTHTRFYLHTPDLKVKTFGEARTSYYDNYSNSLLNSLQPEITTEDATEDPKKIDIAPRGELTAVLRELRTIKSEQEIKMLQRAVDVTLSGHHESFKIAPHVAYEYQVEAAIEYAFMYNGAAAVGYNSIVGCGPNGTILHYDTNRAGFEQGQMFCLDAGAEYRNYTADITRSFPSDGSFSPEQRQIYEIVLAAQRAGEKEFVPGSNYMRVDKAIRDVVAKGLVDLGLIKREIVEKTFAEIGRNIRGFSLAENVVVDGEVVLKVDQMPTMEVLAKLTPETKMKVYDNSQLAQLYPHGWGHPIGLDVHDVVSSGPFAKNMVWTIEPGIYISDRIDFEIDPKYMNIGVRIEDMYVITDEGNRCMSAALPREVEAIEQAMKEKSHLVLRQHKHEH